MKSNVSQHAQADAYAPPLRTSWPEGATAGVLIAASACLALSMTIYHMAGPRDLFAEERAGAE